MISCIAGVPSMISSDAMPATGEPRTTRGTSPQASAVLSPTPSTAGPDVRHVLDPDPVQLDILPIGEVCGVPGVLGGDLADGAQRFGGQLPAVDPDPHHEELVFEFLRLEDGRAATIDAGGALGVQPPPAHPATQVAGIDAVVAGVAVTGLDPLPHVQPVVVLLHPLVDIQRLAVAQRPLPLAAGNLRSRLASHRGARRRRPLRRRPRRVRAGPRYPAAQTAVRRRLIAQRDR